MISAQAALALWIFAASPLPHLVPVDPPAVSGAMAPNLIPDGRGFLLSWLEPVRPGAKPGDGDWALRFARFAQGRWSPPREIVKSAEFFVNWADFPSIAAGGNALYAHWAEMSGPGKYSYDVQLARSVDGGATWKRLGKAHDDATETEHGFVSFVPEGRGVRAFWLDGRRMTGEGGDMNLYTTRVEERPGRGEALDARVCECCQTSAATTSRGPVIAYRDRSAQEVRDIALVRRVAGRWTNPTLVHADGWKIEGCPVNGPAVAADRDRVAVAWFTGAGDRPRVLAAFSEDAGASFGPAIVVDDAEPLGRVDIVAGGTREAPEALVSWVGKGAKGAEVRIRRVSPGGSQGVPLVVVSTTADRSSGFPRLERNGPILLLAWVETAPVWTLRAGTLEESRVPPVASHPVSVRSRR